MAKIFAHPTTTACNTDTIAAEPAVDATQLCDSIVVERQGPDERQFIPDQLDRLQAYADVSELGSALYEERASLNFACPHVQALIVQVKGTFHGELLHELAWPTSKPAKQRFRGPKRRPSAHAGPLPSLFDELTD